MERRGKIAHNTPAKHIILHFSIKNDYFRNLSSPTDWRLIPVYAGLWLVKVYHNRPFIKIWLFDFQLLRII